MPNEPHKSTAGRLRLIGSTVGIALLLGIAAIILLTRHTTPTTTATQHGCTSQTLSPGATGNCVKDVQTMVNFMETDNLAECRFTGGTTIAESGIYDTPTKTQIKVVQTWLNCYSKQEGGAAIVSATGTVSPTTWVQLCNYAYRFPNQSRTSASPYAQATITAGKNAGCFSST